MDIGDAKITITADDKASAKMGEVGKSTSNLGDKFKKLGVAIAIAAAAMATFVAKAVHDWADAGDALDKMTDRTGVAVDKLAELDYILKLSGSSLDDFEKANKKLSKTIYDADYGLETYVRTFEALGLDVKELMKMSPEEQFWAVANALAAVESKTQQIQLAQEVFGKAGTAILPMLAGGSEGILAMQQEFAEFGYQWTKDATEAAAALNDASQQLAAAWEKIQFTLIQELDLAERLNQLSEWLKNVSTWITENRDTVDNVIETVKFIGKLFYYFMKLLLYVGDAIAGLVGLFDKDYFTHPFRTVIRDIIPEQEDIYTSPELSSMGAGGIVPGPFGSPVPIMAHGGEMVSGLHGEAMGGTTVNISMGNFLGDESSLREFVRGVKDIFNQDVRRTSFSGVNSLGYYPGSSAP